MIFGSHCSIILEAIFIKGFYVNNNVCIFDNLREKYGMFQDFYDNEKIEDLITEVEGILNLNGKVFEIGEALNIIGFSIFRIELDSNIGGIFIRSAEIENILGKDRNKVVLLNKDKSLEEQRFTMAHELGHYIFDYRHNDYFSMHASEETDTRNEKRASRFAAALLMRKDMFIESFNNLKASNCNQEEFLIKLAHEYCVPQSTVVKRINELRLQLVRIENELWKD